MPEVLLDQIVLLFKSVQLFDASSGPFVPLHWRGLLEAGRTVLHRRLVHLGLAADVSVIALLELLPL